MPILFKNKKQASWMIPIALLAPIFFAFLPLIVMAVGLFVEREILGNSCGGGNCPWTTLWVFCIFTFPIGGIGFLVSLIFIGIDLSKLNKQNRNE